MKPRLKARWLLLAPLLVSTMATAQNLYKWVDESGRVTYSDQPPIGKVKSQEVVKILGSTNTGAARQITDQDAQFKKRQDDAAKKQADTTKKEEFENVRQEACSRARGELRALRENMPVARLTEGGERIVIDYSAREAEAKRLETFLGENCTPSNG
jgi:Domain of unknown function (DUF4124)